MNQNLSTSFSFFNRALKLFSNPLDIMENQIKGFLEEASELFDSQGAFLRILHFPEDKISGIFCSDPLIETNISPTVINSIDKIFPVIDYDNLNDTQIYEQAKKNFTDKTNKISVMKNFFEDNKSLYGFTLFTNTMPIKEDLIKELPQTGLSVGNDEKVYYPVAQFFLIFDSDSSLENIKKQDELMLNLKNFLSISIDNRIKLQITDDAKKRYRMFLDQSKDTIWAADLNFKFIYMSPAVLPLRGYTAQEAIEQPVNEMFVPESVQKIYTIYTQAREMLAADPCALGWPEGIEVLAKCKDGSKIWNEVTAQFTRNDKGEVVGFVGISRDIDRRKKIEQQLEYKRKFENLITKFAIDFINIPIDQIDQNISKALEEIGKFQSCDSSWLFMIDRPGRASIVSQWLAEDTPDEIGLWQDIDTAEFSWFVENLFSSQLIALNTIDELPENAAPLKNLLIKRGIKSFIAAPVFINSQIVGFVGMDQKNNSIQWSDDVKTIVKITGQIFSNILSRKVHEEELNSHRNNLEQLVKNRTIELEQSNEQLMSEIEIRKKAETDLVKSELRFKSVFDNSLDCIMVLDSDFKLIFENKAAREQARKIDLSFTEENFSKLPEEFKDFKRKWIPHIQKAFNTGMPLRREDTIKIKGREIILEATFSPMKDAAGHIFAVGIIYRDVTAKKDLERKLQNSEKLESLGFLAGGIAHDFNNYLHTIVNSSVLAKTEISNNYPKDPALLKTITRITKSAENASGLATQLLTLSKGGAPIKGKTDIHELISEALEINVSMTDNIEIDFRPSESVKPFNADNGQISQVLANLIINAKQAMGDKGKIIIETGLLENYKLEEKSFRDDYVYIAIKDTGKGIPKEQLEHIFDPFFTTKKTGSGIGLTLINSIIKKHDGDLKVSSREGVGTCFEIYLPSLTPIDEAEVSKPFKRSQSNKSLKILFMDDVEEIRETITETLKPSEYEVELACHGEEALSKYEKAMDEEKPFDAVILDLTIQGGMGGIETLNAIKDINPDVCAIVSSGYAHNPVMSDYKKYGFRARLSKPYQLKDIQTLFNGLFED